MHRHHAKRVFLVKRTKLWGPQVDCQELQKPPRVSEISHLRAGAIANQMKKDKTFDSRYRTSGRGALANQMKKDKTSFFI